MPRRSPKRPTTWCSRSALRPRLFRTSPLSDLSSAPPCRPAARSEQGPAWRVAHEAFTARYLSMAHTIASNKPREFLPRIRRAIENLSPYQSLALLAVPACIVEPLKFAAIAIAGEGHWFTGTAVIVGAYATDRKS